MLNTIDELSNINKNIKLNIFGSIEPDYYYPILPLMAINGSQGIGTGYSTNIPMYNPMDICKYIRAKIDFS